MGFALRMARRELRAHRRRALAYMGAIATGVAALVAVNSFRSDVARAVSRDARAILGADLELRSRQAFTAPILALIDSLEAAGHETARAIRFGSMVYTTANRDAPRLLEVNALEGGYPFYGTVATEPPEAWRTFREGRRAVVDPAVLVYLGAAIGDTLRIGDAAFEIAGVLTEYPGELGVRVAVGPRVFIPLAYVEETNLLRFGSLASHRAYFRIEDTRAVERLVEAYDSLFDAERTRVETVAEVEEELGEALGSLARFLGLIALAALLLGCVGVASAVHVFVTERTETIAVLRCLGARPRTVFAIYLIEAAALGAGGAAIGAAAGTAIQFLLPALLAAFVPVDIEPRVNLPAVGGGLALGALVALAFALLPLLRIREVTPLRALRRDFAGRVRRLDSRRAAVLALLAAGVTAASIGQAPDVWTGLGFAAGIAATAALLAATAWLLMRGARRWLPRRAGYAVRQGVANLFRPQNQTLAATLGIGFGVFLLATLRVVQVNVLGQLEVDAGPHRPNLALFDIQDDQAEALNALLVERGVTPLASEAIVPARISAVNGRPVAEILADTMGRRPPRWVLNREYRNTYRDTLVETETLTAGRWWDDAPSVPGVARISLDEDIAEDLGIGVGDRITWDVQGVLVESEVASLRRINWARLATNFFVVFEPGSLDGAPKTHVVLARVEDPAERAALQRAVVERFSNISMLDLVRVQETVDAVLSRAALAVRFMALFSIGAGLIVLVGSVATTRYQRLRESALLRTLGARAREIRRILAVEYLAIGTVAALSGSALAAGAGWGLARFVFDMPYRVPWGSLAAAWLLASALTVAVGFASSRGVVRRPPLATLRELAE
ncbi:MAG TPA: FtsX-like permease family protein [Longimicrobiales bacterium]